MCSLAPRAAAAPGVGAATAFLDRQRGVVASAMAPAATSRHNAGEPTTRRARASDSEASAAPARKRGRHDGGFEHVGVVDPAAASSSALPSRMDKEIVALQGLLKRAKRLPRSAPPAAEKKPAPAPRRSEPELPVPSSAAKRTTASQSQPKSATTEAKNPIAPEVPNKQQRPVEAPPAPAKQEQEQPVQRAAAAKTEVPKKRRPEEEEEEEEKEKELARAAARAAFRQMLVEMEKSALKDETVYPEEMEELGIPFEFLVTRTWKQAMLDYHAKKPELLGV